MKIRLDRLFLIKSLGVVISHSVYRIGESSSTYAILNPSNVCKSSRSSTKFNTRVIVIVSDYGTLDYTALLKHEFLRNMKYFIKYC